MAGLLGLLGALTAPMSDPDKPGILDSIRAQYAPKAYEAQQTNFGQQAIGKALGQVGASPEMAAAMGRDPRMLQQAGGAYLPGAPSIQEGGTDPLTGQKYLNQVTNPGGGKDLQIKALGSSGPSGFQPPGADALLPAGASAPGTLPAGAIPGQAGAPTAAQTAEVKPPPEAQRNMVSFRNAAVNGVQGEGLYEYLPIGAKQFVQSIVEGRSTLTPMALRNPALRPYLEAAQIVDPSLNVNDIAARAKALDNWRGGKDADSVRSLNQALLHIAGEPGAETDNTKKGLIDFADQLPAHNITSLNPISNFVHSNLLGEGSQNGFLVKAHAAADELGKIWKGSNLSDTEIKAWESSLSPNMSQEQIKTAVAAFMGLVRGAQQSLEDKRTQGVGPLMASKMDPLLSKSGKTAFEKTEKWVQPPAPTATPNAAAAAQEVRQDAQGNKWTKDAQGHVVPYKGK